MPAMLREAGGQDPPKDGIRCFCSEVLGGFSIKRQFFLTASFTYKMIIAHFNLLKITFQMTYHEIRCTLSNKTGALQRELPPGAAAGA